MGYTTDFKGQFNLDRPLDEAHWAYLKAFASSRRMKRDVKQLEAPPDPIRVAAGLPLGHEGAYYIGTGSDYEDDWVGVIDHNTAPGQPTYEERRRGIEPHPQGQPGLWCQWVPTEGCDGIEWDGGEKFYDYTPWLKYLIEHFLDPWGYVLSGEVKWYGEDRGDRGKIVVENNVVTELPRKRKN